MCLETFAWTAQEAQAPSKPSVSSELVEEILAQAAQAGLEAPNRAMKRRVRQRLHKKLGSMLSCEESMASMGNDGSNNGTTHDWEWYTYHLFKQKLGMVYDS
eukprot:s2022_g1.t1